MDGRADRSEGPATGAETDVLELQPIPLLTVALTAAAVLVFVVTRYPAAHARLLAVSLIAHLASALVMLWLVTEVYGIGDLLMYHYFGADLADAMRMDFFRVFPRVLGILFQQENQLSVYVPAAGSDIASMVAISGLMNLMFSNSLVAASLAFATASFCGKLALLQAFFESVPRRLHTAIVVGTMLVPSSVLWSSGIIKESIAVPALGLFLLGVVRLSHGKRTGGLWVALGAVGIGLVKPYILLVAVVATGVYAYLTRASRQGQLGIRPLTLVVGGILTIGACLAIGEIFPRFSLDRLAAETARLQAASLNPMGGSTYAIGDPTAHSFWAQVSYVPQAILTGIYRPLLLEARNPQMLINALETSAFLGLTVYALWSRSITELWRVFVRYPILSFCVVFVVVFGAATGLTAANLGTLSRYRMPLIPFFVTAMVVWIWAPVTVRRFVPAPQARLRHPEPQAA